MGNNVDILSEIVARRRADLAELGLGFGCEVPTSRSRPVVPFLQKPGVILEVKRASPSKGNIAPTLDAAATATAYAAAGARAISVLTEKNFFKGSLADLKAASAAAPDTAILRKDFILSPEEIGVSYLCGADAVLLIARILEQKVLAACIAECAKFGMTAFVEVRTDEDAAKVRHGNLDDVLLKHLVVGVNARDLATFSIDPLVPVAMKSILGGRVVSESGILTPEAAGFAGSLGFHGILVGEAAARDVEAANKIVEAFEANVQNAQKQNRNSIFWQEIACKVKSHKLPGTSEFLEASASTKIANSNLAMTAGEVLLRNRSRPFVKICGITNLEDALCALKAGADFLGFVFAAKSPRCVEGKVVRAIAEKIKKENEALKNKDGTLQTAKQFWRCKLVGVIVDADSPEGQEALALANEGVLDAVQFHGCQLPSASECAYKNIAGYAAVRVGDTKDIDKVKVLALQGQPRILIDAFAEGEAGGTGKRIAEALVGEAKKVRPLWLAGGITPENVAEILEKFLPELIDVSSGVELAPGKKDGGKIKKLFEQIDMFRQRP